MCPLFYQCCIRVWGNRDYEQNQTASQQYFKFEEQQQTSK